MAFDIPKIKNDLTLRVADLVAELAPGGTVKGKYYKPCNPIRTDNKPGSFFIWISGPKTGAWVESVSGEKGDIIDLIAYCMRFGDRGATLHWASKWLNGQAVSTPDPSSFTSKKDQKEEPGRDELRERAAKWFKRGMALKWGGPGKAYFKSRGIELHEWPKNLVFFKSENHGFTGTSWPCIMASYTNHKQEIVGVHRTFLAKDGSGKAPIDPVRLSWPAGYGGGAIRLHEGECRTLVITEGIEDALSVVMACPWCAVWAAGALWNIERLRVPHCEQVIIFADNDWGKPEAQMLLDRGVEAIKNQEQSAYIARSPIGKDANDGLLGGGVAVVEAAILEAVMV